MPYLVNTNVFCYTFSDVNENAEGDAEGENWRSNVQNMLQQLALQQQQLMQQIGEQRREEEERRERRRRRRAEEDEELREEGERRREFSVPYPLR